MTPAFGFSVGDFISAIELCGKVSKALKDTAVGASADYQHVVLELHSLQTALSRLASLEPTESNINHVNAIRGMALTCQLPLQEFLSNIEKYEKTMGPFAGNTLRGAGHKARWAVFVTEEVKKIRALISAKTISINLLLAMHTSETVSTLESRGRTQHNELLRNIEEHRSRIEGVSRRVEEVKDEVAQSSQSTATRFQNLDTEMKSRLDSISGNTVELAQNMSTLSVQMDSTQNSLLSLRDTGSQILAFLRKFPADIRALMQSIVRSNMQMYYILLKIDGKVFASPSLLNQSNIRFEDALGVVRELPHEWFKHWEPFEGLLKAQFKDAPGEQKVLQGLYQISYAKRPGVLISKENWTRSVQPGSEIVMSILMTEMLWQGSSCPRQSCSGKPQFDRDKLSIVVCALCGLKYIPLLSMCPQVPKHVAASEEDRVSQYQAEEDLVLFGNRDIPSDFTFEEVAMHALGGFKAIPPDGTPGTNLFERENDDHYVDGSDSRSEENDTDNGAGFASSHGESDAEVDYAFWTPARNIAHQKMGTSISHDSAPRITSTSSIDFSNHLQSDLGPRAQSKPRRHPIKSRSSFVQDADTDVDISDNDPGVNMLQPSLQRPPLLSWLDKTQPPEHPTKIQDQLQERQASQERAKAHEMEDIELLRNVLVVPSERELDVPTGHEKPLEFGEDSLELGAQIYYRNILDRYPAIPNYLARRLANANLCRIKRLSSTKTSTAASPRTFYPNIKRFSSFKRALSVEKEQGSLRERRRKRRRKTLGSSNYWTGENETARPASRRSSMNSSLHGSDIPDPQDQDMNVLSSSPGNVNSLGSRVDPTLPPPPVELPAINPFKCDICEMTIHTRRKRDWKKHVLHDLRPYICVLENCKSPDETFSRRRDLINHENLDHGKIESCYQCTIPQCEAKLKDPYSIHYHQWSDHGIPVKELNNRLEPGGILPTKPCLWYHSGLLMDEYGCDRCEADDTSFCLLDRPCRQCKDAGVPCGKSKSQLDTTWGFDLSKVQIPDLPCLFCEEPIAPGNLPRSHHLGHHMEEISFAIVTKSYEDWQFYDNSSSGGSGRSLPGLEG